MLQQTTRCFDSWEEELCHFSKKHLSLKFMFNKSLLVWYGSIGILSEQIPQTYHRETWLDIFVYIYIYMCIIMAMYLHIIHRPISSTISIYIYIHICEYTQFPALPCKSTNPSVGLAYLPRGH